MIERIVCKNACPTRSYHPAYGYYGVVASTFATAFTSGPDYQEWDNVYGFAMVQGHASLTSVTFQGWSGVDACGIPNAALTNNPKAPDAFHPHDLSAVTLANVASGGLLKLHPVNPTWRNLGYCGLDSYNYTSAFSAVAGDGTDPSANALPLNCAGPAHALFRDLDGSLTGAVGALAGLQPQPRPALSQGVMAASADCSQYLTSSAVQLDTTLVTSPLAAYFCPAAAYDPQLFVLESLDTDTATRNFSPLTFTDTSSGQTDILVSSASQVPNCAGLSCQLRLSTFWTLLGTGRTHQARKGSS